MILPQTFFTPNGKSLILCVREDTNDGALAHGILSSDEYALHGRFFSGWALDIGAHIGSVGIALAVDNPDLSVVCVEPVPDNAAIIRRSVAENGLEGRVFVEEAGAAAIGTSTVPCHYGYTKAGIPDQGYVIQNRFVGNLWRDNVVAEGEYVDAPAVTIKGLAEKYGVKYWDLCKIDCEGCEWSFFQSDTNLIDTIIGEWHDGPFSRIADLLSGTHDVELVTDYGGSGIFWARPK